MKARFNRKQFFIVSGGQTGADQAALDWAINNGVAHLGWCPKGRRTEEGALDVRFRLSETPSSSYLQRTEWNVRDSDATLIFSMSEVLTGGSKQTADFATQHGKPFFVMSPARAVSGLISFLAEQKIERLNVAGSRKSTAPDVAEFVDLTLDVAIQLVDDDKGASSSAD